MWAGLAGRAAGRMSARDKRGQCSGCRTSPGKRGGPVLRHAGGRTGACVCLVKGRGRGMVYASVQQNGTGRGRSQRAKASAAQRVCYPWPGPRRARLPGPAACRRASWPRARQGGACKGSAQARHAHAAAAAPGCSAALRFWPRAWTAVPAGEGGGGVGWGGRGKGGGERAWGRWGWGRTLRGSTAWASRAGGNVQCSPAVAAARRVSAQHRRREAGRRAGNEGPPGGEGGAACGE